MNKKEVGVARGESRTVKIVSPTTNSAKFMGNFGAKKASQDFFGVRQR